ncbi:molybdenum cofactor cytidylyltransferase [Lutibacter oricola]|uniref:Molybdenum cofactor cytidylyltransferase n=1 Tax=Lutibacter oricola TaxID=762486 RepID=A0A1H3GBY2_9FLAO|nr:nucleotidyltransferase family protein [Lutibacter oricola]SDX99839.1 molybdenum cofactor cytidylyltransferase [Lutibacter oricola]
MNGNTAILILAAGASSRMNRPKQLLPWKNTTLLGAILEQSLTSNLENIVVVLGANSAEIKSKIDFSSINVVENKSWEKGLGNSISFGVNFIQKKLKNIDSILITLADQPFLTGSYFNLLQSTFKTSKKRIIATKIKNRVGVPAIFDLFYFEELKKLNEDKGAKQLISKHKNDVKAVVSEIDFTDIDTLEVYNQLLKNNSK